MKTFSKAIAAIALMAAMTTCLTACEEDSVPAYGTIMEEDTKPIRHELSPTPPVEVPDVEASIYSAYTGYSDDVGEYIAVVVIVINNTNETKEVGYLLGVSVTDDSGRGLAYCTNNITGDENENLSREIGPGEQTYAIYSFNSPSTNFTLNGIEYIDISVQNDVDGVLDSRRYYLTEE